MPGKLLKVHQEEDEYFSDHGDSDQEVGNSNDEAIDVDKKKDEKEEDDKPKKIKVTVRKPQPKLDPSRLCGQRGLKCLLENFADFKPKGEGHEFQDLDRMVNKYEYWAHRLFPKMKFTDVVEKLEKLGDKREVKGALHRIRLNEPDEAKEPNVLGGQNENEDALLENQAMTERVMAAIHNERDENDDVVVAAAVAAAATHLNDEDDNSNSSSPTGTVDRDSARVRAIKPAKNQINDDEEDEDEILRSLLNV